MPYSIGSVKLTEHSPSGLILCSAELQCTASLIEGGVELSSYPGRCKLSIERRTLPGESLEQVEDKLAQLLAYCHDTDAEFEGTHRIVLERLPFEVDPDAELVRLFSELVPGLMTGVSYWADAAFIAAAGIPTVLFGPRGAGAHALEEWVSLSDTELVSTTLVRLAALFCR